MRGWRWPVAGVVLGLVAAAPASAADSIPDFTGVWGRNAFDAEHMPSAGPGPLTNLSRVGANASRPILNGGESLPIMGDYNNAILKPEAAAVVRKMGEISKTGVNFPDPSNMCAPYQPPYLFTIQLAFQMLQSKHEITILYQQDDQVRRVRMNAAHPDHIVPSAMGDSIGHYEGDTLVVDTVGIEVLPHSMVDRYGTPQSGALHLVERYRLIDNDDAKAAQDRHEKVAGRIGGPPGIMPWDEASARGLQVQYTVEDPGVFTMPWSALATYRKTRLSWAEQVCAENTHEYYFNTNTEVPAADRSDF